VLNIHLTVSTSMLATAAEATALMIDGEISLITARGSNQYASATQALR